MVPSTTDDTPMEKGKLQQTLNGSTASLGKEISAGLLPHDDSDKQMDPGIVDILNIRQH